VGLKTAAPPHAPSTCIQTLCLAHTSAIALNGSKAPSTVVPAVAPTKKGTWPLPSAPAAVSAASSAAGSIAPDASQATLSEANWGGRGEGGARRKEC